MLTAKRQGCWPGGEALVMLLAPIRESLPASEPSVLPPPCIWQLSKILGKNVTSTCIRMGCQIRQAATNAGAAAPAFAWVAK